MGARGKGGASAGCKVVGSQEETRLAETPTMPTDLDLRDPPAVLAMARAELPKLLEEWSGLAAEEVPASASGTEIADFDLAYEWAGHRLLVDVRAGFGVADADLGVRNIARHRSLYDEKVRPVLLVPFMPEAGARKCGEAGIDWIDLSGNAGVRIGPVRIDCRGRPNRFSSRGWRANPFTPRSSRIARIFLRDPSHYWRQEELIGVTGLTRGYISKVVLKLESMDLLERDDTYRVRPKDPQRLLDRWGDAYAPLGGEHLPGLVPTRDGEVLARAAAAEFDAVDAGYAFTAMAAAGQYAPPVTYRQVCLYVRERPSDRVCNRLGFQFCDEDKGANLLFLISADDFLWDGTKDVGGIACASALQTWLDLKDLGDRAGEAAGRLREKELAWAS